MTRGAGPRGRHRHLLLRHHDGAPRAGRRDGLRGGEHHRAHHPAGAGVRQDQARGEHGVQRLPDVPGRPGAGLRRLRGDPRADHRAAGRHRDLLGGDGRSSSASSRGWRCCPTRPGRPGPGADVEKVRAATALVAERAPDLALEGPIQYDAAIDPGVARTKLPDSAVAGRATVFIFPDLNTGNNTYKAVQRSAHAVAIGPVLQGLQQAGERPVPRGAGGRHREHRGHHRGPGAGGGVDDAPSRRAPVTAKVDAVTASPGAGAQRRLLVAEVPAAGARDAARCWPRGWSSGSASRRRRRRPHAPRCSDDVAPRWPTPAVDLAVGRAARGRAPGGARRPGLLRPGDHRRRTCWPRSAT